MASFTDSIQEFNPYIQQLPVEAMAKVGMAKQERYNQGIQKIQSDIDNIAGLDILRNVDKQYLQGKLNELGDNLRGVAGGDFSNFQLTNSVAGMTNRFVKDGNIQNAVGSTAAYRKQVSDMDTARKEGKSSIQNESFFNNKANDWLNSDDLNESFNVKYKQYIDVEGKKFLDVFKSLHPSMNEQDMPFAKNPDGSINYNETAAAMQRSSKETVSAATIENALRSAMSPDELDQLNINGWYQFRAYDTPEKLASYSQTKFNTQIASNTSQIKALKGMIDLTTQNPEKNSQINIMIAQLEGLNSELPKRMAEEIDMINTNPDAAKGYIYRNGAIAQFATAYAWENNKENVLTNPVAAQEMDVRKQVLAESKFALEVDDSNWRKQRDVMNYELDLIETNIKISEAQSSNTAKGTSVNLGISPSGSGVTAMDVMNEATDAFDQSEVIKNSILGVDGLRNVTPAQFENAVATYNEGGDLTIIPIEYKEQVDNLIELRNESDRSLSFVNDARSRADNSPEVLELRKSTASELASMSNINFQTPSGELISFTPEEVANYHRKTKTTSKNIGSGQSGSITNETTFNSRLTKKEEILHKNRLNLRSQISKIENLTRKESERITELTNSDISERSFTKAGIFTAADISTKKLREQFNSTARANLAVLDEDINGQAGGDVNFKQEDVEKAYGWLNGDDANKINYGRLDINDKTYYTLSLGDENIKIPIQSLYVSDLPIKPTMFVSPMIDKLTKTMQEGRGSTNISGSYATAYFTKKSMPMMMDLNIKADLTSSKGNSEKSYITLRLLTPQGSLLSLQLSDNPVDKTQAIDVINKLTKESVKKLFLGDNRISQEKKALIEQL